MSAPHDGQDATSDVRVAASDTLSRLSHGLRGSASIALGALDELEQALDRADAPKQQQFLAMARRAVQRALSQVDELSSLDRNAAARAGVAHAALEANPRLLLVEDDDDARELLRLYLSRKGCKVDAVGSLGEARRALEAMAYSVLLTDLELGDGDGRELLANGRPPGVALALVMSGATSDEERARTRAVGFDDHLAKPLHRTVLDRLLTLTRPL